ncbi:MAG: tRNA 2-thiouridine(34) synthase MnmA [Tissierellaceae bacterium]|nr:tRNA 2-thiouridine(34) synthase MnmA [Tissierellaceae bacterium]
MKKKVVLGMSGGVDSSVAAYILQQEGYEVIGVTMSVIPHDDIYDERAGGCCSISSVFDAKQVAQDLGIPHYVMNFRGVFERKVIDYFIDEYLEGRTPNPCVACNKFIKFDEFLKKAKGLGADYIATGHYATIGKDKITDRYLMKRALDQKKDQTYFLYGMTQYQLAHTLMPLGKYTKETIREIAEKINLVVHNKPDSEEICFVPDNDHGKFIKSRVPHKVKPGNFVDKDGKVLGKHKGIVYYTIGQRKGLGISLGKRVFVQKIDPEKNEIVLGDEEGIFKNELYADQLNIIAYDKLPEELEITAKVRYSMKESKAVMKPYKEGVLVEFDEDQRAITRGQSIVFYKGEIVLGGGTIREVY